MIAELITCQCCKIECLVMVFELGNKKFISCKIESMPVEIYFKNEEMRIKKRYVGRGSKHS